MNEVKNIDMQIYDIAGGNRTALVRGCLHEEETISY